MPTWLNIFSVIFFIFMHNFSLLKLNLLKVQIVGSNIQVWPQLSHFSYLYESPISGAQFFKQWINTTMLLSWVVKLKYIKLDITIPCLLYQILQLQNPPCGTMWTGLTLAWQTKKTDTVKSALAFECTNNTNQTSDILSLRKLNKVSGTEVCIMTLRLPKLKHNFRLRKRTIYFSCYKCISFQQTGKIYLEPLPEWKRN